MIKDFKLEELRYYVMSCLLWHYPPNRILEACVDVGWKKEHVMKVLEEERRNTIKKYAR